MADENVRQSRKRIGRHASSIEALKDLKWPTPFIVSKPISPIGAARVCGGAPPPLCPLCTKSPALTTNELRIWRQGALRSEERRRGKECVGTCGSRWLRYTKQK